MKRLTRPGPTNVPFFSFLVLALCGIPAGQVQAAKLSSVGILDQDYLVVNILDGQVSHDESTPGAEKEGVTPFTPALNVSEAAKASNWTITSSQDTHYGSAGQRPLACFRKTKLNGHAQLDWVQAQGDYNYATTYQHWIYLHLPTPLQQGATYTLDIGSSTNSDKASASFTFDVYNTRSEAVHVNLAGYDPDAPHKAADLYHWMGDGGARDYSAFVGKTVYVYDVAKSAPTAAGQVSEWAAKGSDVFGYNLLRSKAWNVDFSGFATPGTYRLVVEGVGASQDFTIASDVYGDPFRIAIRGYFYMRVGQAKAASISPPSRTPLYRPGGSDPANTVVYLTTMQQFHSEWGSFTNGDPWDSPDKWAAYRKSGNPTNPNAWGGHADAWDWDRHLGHISSIYDMLLPFILSGGAIDDDTAGIAESGNQIPDIIDEAAFEVDYWLRLRDGDGYGSGLTNPNGKNELFQAGPTAISAWANAANASMLAEAYRLAGQTSLMNKYRTEAVTAYTYASGLSDTMLDKALDVGNGPIRGRDLKMTAAAYLYNLTGDQAYESVINSESVCKSDTAEIWTSSLNQTWATAAYLTTPQQVHFPTLQSNMKSSIIQEAKKKEANSILSRPSRRATDEANGYFRTGQNVQRTLLAHKVASSQADKDFFRKALALEADWGLGRNPLNMIEMGTATTPLAAKRSVEYMYTAGQSDGVPGLVPGHTPYMNLDDWGGMVMASPSRLHANSYPSDFKNTWPIGEGYFNTPWVWAHSEYTPQQTFRGKIALYGYLYSLGRTTVVTPRLSVTKVGTGSGTVSSSPPGIDCGSTCNASFSSGTAVTLTATPAAGSTFAGWSGACSGTGTCTVTVNGRQSATARFDGSCTGDEQCDDSDSCTTDLCSPTAHSCSHTPIANCPSDAGVPFGSDAGPAPSTITSACGCSAPGDPIGLLIASVLVMGWVLRRPEQ